MQQISSEWYGPLRLVPVPTKIWVAENPQALRAGVYLWTARIGDEYRVHYVGMSTNSITVRTMEHLSYSFGINPVDKPESFRQGIKGDFLFSRSEQVWEHVREDVLPGIIEYIKEVRLFIAPIDVSKFMDFGDQELKRIESAIIDMVRNYEADKTPFLTNHRRSKVVTHRDIQVKISLPNIDLQIAGISSVFDA